MTSTTEILKRAKAASARLAILSEDEKNRALLAMADALVASAHRILDANAADIENARGTISEVMLDRLRLDGERIASMSRGIRDVAALPDPTWRVLDSERHANGMTINKVSVPLGVLGIIYESRPNVTSDAAALSFKSGNACVLKPGKEAHRTSSVIVTVLRDAVKYTGLCDAINVLEDNSRTAASELMSTPNYVDALIPRGGAGLIRYCTENSKVPCIQTGTGICHIYVDAKADAEKALDIIENAKTSRPSVCNAAEVCLVNRNIAADFLPRLAARLSGCKHPVELRLDAEAARIISGTPASKDDFDTEFLDYTLAVAIVGDVREAAEHIAAHSTHHSEAIITEDATAAEYFTRTVDSAAVYVNASTRFTDGGEFGLGCEIGISTQKLHARGPMGLRELTTYKYVIKGNGQIR